MEFNLNIISIIHRFSGFGFVVLSVVHGILVAGRGDPPNPCILGLEEGGETDGPSPLAFVVGRVIVVIIYDVYAVHGGGGKERIGPPHTPTPIPPPPESLLILMKILARSGLKNLPSTLS